MALVSTLQDILPTPGQKDVSVSMYPGCGSKEKNWSHGKGRKVTSWGQDQSMHFPLGHIFFTLMLNKAREGFPGGSAVKNPPAMQEMQVQSLGWEDPWRKWQPATVLLPGKSHGQRSLAGRCLASAAAAAAAAAKSFQSCPTLCDPIDGSPPGPAVPGVL